MNASLNEKLRTVKWGEYKLSDIFSISNTPSFNTEELVAGNQFDYVTRTSANQGVLRTTGFINADGINPAGTWSLGLLQMDFFFRNRPWYAGQFMRIITPKIEIPERAVLFFTAILNMQKPVLLSVLVRNVDKTFKSIKIELPVSTDGKIDFHFMESIINELEKNRMVKLSTYFESNGLNEYELTEQDNRVLDDLGNVNWKEYRIGDLFEKAKTTKLHYKAKDLPSEATLQNPLPALTSSFNNQGLNYYVPRQGATVLKDVITIPQNSDVYRAYYQSSEFTVLSDAYAMEWKYDHKKLTREQFLFLVMCINKVTDRPIYSHKNKLGGWNVVKNISICLPQRNNEIDFDFMHSFISAIQKTTVKDVIFCVKRRLRESCS